MDNQRRLPRRPGAAAVVAWLRLARIYQRIDRASAVHLRCWNLSVAQFDVLAHVGSAEGVTQQDLARALLVTKGNICQLLDRMERRGWLRRRHEGRANQILLTGAGRALFGDVLPAQEAFIAGHFEGVSLAQQRQLRVLLRTLDRAVGHSCGLRDASS